MILMNLLLSVMSSLANHCILFFHILHLKPTLWIQGCIKWPMNSENNMWTWGKHLRALLMWGLWDFHSCPAALNRPPLPPPSLTPSKTDALSRIPPHATAPTFPEVPAEAVTVGPSAGNFLWRAGNDLTWGLDSAEKSTGEHLETSPLSRSRLPQGISSTALFHLETR